MNETTEKQEKPKSKIIAFILNIFAPGAAFFYIGKIKLAILFIPLIICFNSILIYISTILNNAYFILIGNIISLLLIISSFIIPLILIHKKKYKKTKYSNVIYSIGFIILVNSFYFSVLYFSDYFPVRIFKIPAGSMKNTIQIGDYIVSYKSKDIKKGDLIIFKYPSNPEILYLKRVIAEEGDIVAIKDKKLLLHLKEGNDYIKKNYLNYKTTVIDGKTFLVNPYKNRFEGIYNDPLVKKEGYQILELFDMAPIKIPKNEYFVMGDNRDHSNDSRFWGTLPKELIYGKTNLVYLNLENWDRFNLKIK